MQTGLQQITTHFLWSKVLINRKEKTHLHRLRGLYPWWSCFPLHWNNNGTCKVVKLYQCSHTVQLMARFISIWLKVFHSRQSAWCCDWEKCCTAPSRLQAAGWNISQRYWLGWAVLTVPVTSPFMSCDIYIGHYNPMDTPWWWPCLCSNLGNHLVHPNSPRTLKESYDLVWWKKFKWIVGLKVEHRQEGLFLLQPHLERNLLQDQGFTILEGVYPWRPGYNWRHLQQACCHPMHHNSYW